MKKVLEAEFVKGIRVANGSIKIHKLSDGRFLVTIKRYFHGIKYSEKRKILSSMDEAEDYFVSAKFERRI